MLGADVPTASITVFFTAYLKPGEDETDGKHCREHSSIAASGRRHRCVSAFAPPARETRPRRYSSPGPLPIKNPSPGENRLRQVRPELVCEVMRRLAVARSAISYPWANHLRLDHASFVA